MSEDWLIRASDMTVSEQNTIYEAIMKVETEREKDGNYRKMFAHVFNKDWVNDITPCGIEEKKMCYHKAEGSDKE